MRNGNGLYEMYTVGYIKKVRSTIFSEIKSDERMHARDILFICKFTLTLDVNFDHSTINKSRFIDTGIH